VIIPSFDEMSNIKREVLKQVQRYLARQKYSWEVILADDGSTDGTVAELEKFAAEKRNWRVLKNKHAGKGPTVAAGMLAARGEWRLFCDFDQSTPISELGKFWSETKKADVVIGSRAMPGAKRQREPFYRHLMGVGFNLLTRVIALPGIHDSQCGFKLLSAKATEELFVRLYIYNDKNGKKDAFTGAFDVELLFLARKKGFKIKEVPVVWIHNRTQRVSPLKDSGRMLWDIVRIRGADLTGKYKQ
jgi:glycosyltransferase involved in cell wall biosynthesis